MMRSLRDRGQRIINHWSTSLTKPVNQDLDAESGRTE